jgi:hypothetical protein
VVAAVTDTELSIAASEGHMFEPSFFTTADWWSGNPVWALSGIYGFFKQTGGPCAYP